MGLNECGEEQGSGEQARLEAGRWALGLTDFGEG
jgi:hypothetical protein